MAFLDASGIPGGSRILGCRASIVTKFSPICADSHAFQSGRKTTKKIVSMTEKCPKNRNRGLMTAIAVISRYSGHSTVGQYEYMQVCFVLYCCVMWVVARSTRPYPWTGPGR